jgi:hypothetical protein
MTHICPQANSAYSLHKFGQLRWLTFTWGGQFSGVLVQNDMIAWSSQLPFCWNPTFWKSSFCFWELSPLAWDLLAGFCIPSSLMKVSWEVVGCRGKNAGLIYCQMLLFFIISNVSGMLWALFSSRCARWRKPLVIIGLLFLCFISHRKCYTSVLFTSHISSV